MARSAAAPPADRLPRPPYDPEMRAQIEARGDMPEKYDLETLRANSAEKSLKERNILLSDPSVTVEDTLIQGPRGPLPVAIVRPTDEKAESTNRPCIMFLHGGCFIAANRYGGLDCSIPWAKEFSAVTVSVEYGLSPENPGIEPVKDCYAALVWISENIDELGIDRNRLVVYGASAGGGIAASLALMARDVGGPKLRGLFLECPMLDDRNDSVSCQQFATGALFNSTLNRYSWAWRLGGTRCISNGDSGDTSNVSPYEAPARATDLQGLPPTFLDCASAEPFRDEIVHFALRLHAAGVAAECHTWDGGPHGFDRFMPGASVSEIARMVRLNWLWRLLMRGPDPAAAVAAAVKENGNGAPTGVLGDPAAALI